MPILSCEISSPGGECRSLEDILVLLEGFGVEPLNKDARLDNGSFERLCIEEVLRDLVSGLIWTRR